MNSRYFMLNYTKLKNQKILNIEVNLLVEYESYSKIYNFRLMLRRVPNIMYPYLFLYRLKKLIMIQNILWEKSLIAIQKVS